MSRTVVWLNDAMDRIYAGKNERLEVDAALHGIEIEKPVEETAEAPEEKLAEVGIGFGGR